MVIDGGLCEPEMLELGLPKIARAGAFSTQKKPACFEQSRPALGVWLLGLERKLTAQLPESGLVG